MFEEKIKEFANKDSYEIHFMIDFTEETNFKNNYYKAALINGYFSKEQETTYQDFTSKVTLKHNMSLLVYKKDVEENKITKKYMDAKKFYLKDVCK